jgi:phosphocarrier protein
MKQQLKIVNKLGLHARAAAKLVKTASAFESEVQIRRNHREVNAKSIMGVMLLAAGYGSEVELKVDGVDESEAMAQLQALIESGFGEDE